MGPRLFTIQTNRNNCHNFPHLQEERRVPFVYNPNETTVTTFPTYRRNDVCRFTTQTKQLSQLSPPTGGTTCAVCLQPKRNNCHNFPHLQEERRVPFVYNPNETTVTTFHTYRRNDVCRLSTTQTKQLSQLSPPTVGTTCTVCHTGVQQTDVTLSLT